MSRLSHLLFIFSIPLLADGKKSDLDPKVLLREIARHGADSVLSRTEGEIDQKLPQTHSEWEQTEWANILRHIETGDSLWLEVAGKCFKAADHGVTCDDLAASVAQALPSAPSRVLRLISGLKKNGIAEKQANNIAENICTPSFSKHGQDAYEHGMKAQNALKKVRNKKLEPVKKRCLEWIIKDLGSAPSSSGSKSLGNK
ncbi:MAG TPA: hypothetical protein DCQ83_04030 [Fibrobacteres bacterium]|jgi:hypothetical protein|nr:hypothetical protein [Fibrobacterota bacterium]